MSQRSQGLNFLSSDDSDVVELHETESPNASGVETLNMNIMRERRNTQRSFSNQTIYTSPEPEKAIITEDESADVEERDPVRTVENVNQQDHMQNNNHQLQTRNPHARRWVFTWNNPPENWKVLLAQITAIKALKTKFIIGGYEVGTETETPHIQGYVRFDKLVYYRTLRSKLQIFWDVANGNEAQNIEYCLKQGGDNFKWGTPVTVEGKGIMTAQSRVLKLREDVVKMAWTEFETAHPVESTYQKNIWINYKYEHSVMANVWEGELRQKNFWIWGPPGTGKSRWAWNQGGNIYLKSQNKWWDGFHLEEYNIVLLEDWPNDKAMLAPNMKTWADRYKFIAEVKGGTIWVAPGKYRLVVTSNYSIEQCFNPGDVDAIKRRFNEIHIENGDDIRLTMKMDDL